MNGKKSKLILAEYESSGALLRAAEKVRDAGYKRFDCHSPFPIHGMDEAMGLKRSPLGWIVGLMALIGGGGALVLQWWTSAVDYPIVAAGKPFFSYQAFVPVTFGLAVLFGAIASVVGMLGLNKLPRLHHPVFYSENFGKFSEGGFFISVESSDPQFDIDKTQELLESSGGYNMEVIE